MEQHSLPSLRGIPRILPSLLQCDFGNLGHEIGQLEEAGISALHLDVMDGHFVPNFTYGMTIVRAVRRLTQLPVDVHLMIDRPDKYLSAFREAGADHITIHLEASQDPTADLRTIRDLGATAGLAINPGTEVRRLADYRGLCDLILIMSVQAGFGGQSFHEGSLDRLQSVRQHWGDEVMLQIDGGIKGDNIARCVAAGAEFLVVGSAIFAAEDYGQAVQSLQSQMIST